MRRFVVSILGVSVLAVSTAFAEATLKAYCEFTEVKANELYWTCKCNSCGMFGVEVAGYPENRNEWVIESPTYKWTGFEFNPDDQAIVYYTLQPTDYGKSHTVSVVVTWKMRRYGENGELLEEKTVTKEAELQLDAVELSVLVVTSKGEDGGDLIDNREGEAKLRVLGASADTAKVLPITISSATVEKEGIINNPNNTSIDFTPREDLSLFWDTSTNYWYGVVIEPDRKECCWHYKFKYEFTAKLDDYCVVNNRHAIYMPTGNPQMEAIVKNDSAVSIEVSANGPKRFYLNLLPCYKQGEIKGLPVPNQYAKELEKEEEYHKEQWLGLVGAEKGGELCDFCGTVEALAIWLKGNAFIKWDGPRPYLEEGQGPANNTEQLAKFFLEGAKNKEKNRIIELYNNNGPLRELKAKEHAGFNAGFKYHCTYEGTTDQHGVSYPLEGNVLPRTHFHE